MEENMHDIDAYFDMAIEKYSDMVYRIALNQMKNKSDAEDVFQEVFIKWIQHREELKNDTHEKAWLIRVTLNQCKSLLRSAWFKRTVALEDTFEYISPKEEENEVYQVVLRLPQKYRAVIHLFYYEELSILEISELLRVKESTIRTQLTRARRLLKELLKGEYQDV